jgi:PPM family protein phosphatase
MKFNLVAFSKNGKVRTKNEDGFLLSVNNGENSFISSDSFNEELIYTSGLLETERLISFVIDGMGGMGDGDIARDVLLQSFQSNLSSLSEFNLPEKFNQLLEKANQFLLNVKSVNHYKDMGAVVSSGLFFGSNLYISHIGDTRIYLFREGSLRCLTSDHTYINHLLQSKKINLVEAKSHPLRNMVLKSLGFENVIQPDRFSIPILSGDLILFFTDGVYGEISDTRIESIFKMKISLESRIDELISAILLSECNDNFTGISIQIL